MEKEIYKREIEKAMGEVKEILAIAQNRMGIIESFLYLMNKEYPCNWDGKTPSPGLNGSSEVK